MEEFKKYETKSRFFIYAIVIIILAMIGIEGAAFVGVIALEFPYKPINAPFWTGQIIDNVVCQNYSGSLYMQDDGVWYLVCSNGEVPMSGGDGSPLPKYQKMLMQSGG